MGTVVQWDIEFRLAKDGKRLAKDDRLEDSRIRERLKSGLKKDGQEKKARGPMVAKPNVLPPSSAAPSSTAQITGSNGISSSGLTTRRYNRTPSPNYSDSAFTRQVVSRPNSPVSRGKSPSNSVKVKQNSLSSGRRTPSPSSVLDPVLNSDAAKKRVNKALKARLYLLQQIGPNSLQIGGDSPSHKFKVIIGPQSCSCGKGPHCIHLLFVMLRVLQVSESDPSLWNRELKNFEVESLFANFYDRRKKKRKSRSPSAGREKKRDENIRSSQESLSGSDTGTNEEEDLCPICLLEMIDGESLVQCEDGCQNKLHHHCISIWFEECRLQNDPLICPLCRTKWSLKQLHQRGNDQKEHCPRAPSPPNAHEMFLPKAEDITEEHRDLAGPWIRLFGEDLVSCLFSRSWVVRETSMPHLSQRVMSALTGETSGGLATNAPEQPTKEELVQSCCEVLAMVCGDPVYKVLVAGLKCLRNLLSCLACTTEEEVAWLKKCLMPVVEIILTKCADSNRRTSQLALSTLEELAKCQQGELAIGRRTTTTDIVGLDDGVDFILKCILKDYSQHSVHWQWLLGRLYMIDRLIDRYPTHFILRQHASEHEDGEKIPGNYERLLSVLKFALKEVNNSHTKIGKYARRVYILSARLTVHIPEIFSQIEGMLSSLDRSLHLRMKRRLSVVANEFTVAQEVALMVQHEPAYDHNAFVTETEEAPQQSDEQTLIPEVPQDPRARRRRNSSPTKRRKSSIPRACRQSDEESNLNLPEGHLTPPPTPKSNENSSHFGYENHQGSGSSTSGKPPIPPRKCGCEQKSNYRPNGSIRHTISLPASREVDLSDVTLSPPTPEDKLITFKTEVATSPKRNIKKPRLPLDTAGWYHTDDPYGCKDEIEEEEMIALACAMEASTLQQEKLPYVPGLSTKPHEVATIKIQPEEEDDVDSFKSVYREDVDWLKGPVLGTGAFSTCYQARDAKTGTIMAMKQIAFCRNSGSDQEKVVDSIKEEFGLMTKLNHPNIVRILGATQEGCHFNMFVEWMPGGSVAYLLEKYGPFTETVLISYTHQVLKGLSYLHEHHIVHRDLKGANLLVDSSGKQVRIADFGASAKLSAHQTQAGEFKGQLLGTVAFMAPEVLRGENYGRSCDIWSIGCVMIEMATCKPPWNASDLSNHLALIFKIASATKAPPIPDHLTPPVRDLMLRCLEHNSEDRPQAKECLKHPLFTQYQPAVRDTGD
ncbi:mitogen-activated protein kinase kinase kinase 1-like isoform X2 [Lineus longissimus]|uniref:mitogen-activated protein kinase kinase kinase 1-like isoform X2 n=1 Tax=Lineus longissimus TaxID=88925 RepID=UPI00315D392B